MTTNNNTSFTPGPWKLVNRYSNSHAVGMNVETDENFIVCRIPDGATVGGGNAWPAQHNNARLIAAAPEMLEYLEHVLTMKVDTSATHDGLNNVCILAGIRAILAKVKGE